MLGLLSSFRQVQLIYAVAGALFFPFLALMLLIFNGRSAWVGPDFSNGPLTSIVLIAVLIVFSWMGLRPYLD
jgi:hypothetical protein